MTQQIDWPGIRAAAVTIGVREAARQAGANLPPDEQNRFVERVLKRCTRQGWITAKAKALSATPTAQAKTQPLSANVHTGAETIANTLAQRKDAGRLNLSQFVVEASEEALRTPAGLKLKVAQDVRHVAAIHTALYPEKETPGLILNLGLLAGGMQ